MAVEMTDAQFDIAGAIAATYLTTLDAVLTYVEAAVSIEVATDVDDALDQASSALETDLIDSPRYTGQHRLEGF